MAEVSIDLSPLVRQMEDLGFQLREQVNQVDQRVVTVATDLRTTRDDVLQLRAAFDEFVQTHERTRLVQLAETRLGTLKADLEREYGHYGIVRRTSIGILQAFDIGNVRNKTVHEISEELMIQTPKYWLAPALVALAAWSKDDQELAEKSVEAAFTRDPKKTSLFFALTLRRQARIGEATRWLMHYFVSLDPFALTREFVVLLEATAQGGFGPEGRQLVLDHLEHWREILRDDPEIVTAQVEKWRSEILSHRGTVDGSFYALLAQWSPHWPPVKSGLEHASAHQFVIDKYEGVRDTVPTLSITAADRLDDLLEILVTEFDAEELPLRREVIYQEAIIAHDGEISRAQEAADLNVAALDETIDALSLQTHTALRPDLFGVSVATQKVAVGSCSDDFSTAVGQFSRDYRSEWPDEVDIVLGSSHSHYASTFGFGEWTTSSAVAQDQAEESLHRHWDAVLQRYIDDQTFTVKKVMTQIIVGVAGALIGILLMTRGGGATAFGAVILLGTLAVAGFLVYQKKQACEKAVAAAKDVRERAKVASVDIYRGVSAEWVDARIVYVEEDAKEADLLELIEGWPR